MASGPEFRAPTGTRDILPPESGSWQAAIATFGEYAQRAAYGFVLTPLFEDLGVFARGVGQGTDIVSKEMYELQDKGGRRLALRPEPTASVVRAFIQHRPPVPWKVWYWGPNFRYERPQAGRYRQFFQLGAEVLGVEDWGADVELIHLAWAFYRALGLSRVRLMVNSLGDQACRPAYRQLLLDHLGERAAVLCDEHQERWKDNPFRVLDCKRQACRDGTADVPAQIDHLCEPCRNHWRSVLEGLTALGVDYQVNVRLVRGLDYYTRTTFEFAAEALDSAQNAVGGGGRYDGLVELLGGPPTAGIGFGIGIDRLLLAAGAEGIEPVAPRAPFVFVVDLVGGAEGTVIAEELRRAGLSADRAFGSRSLKAQMKAADRSGAEVAVIVGEDEVGAGTATLRTLRGDQHDQQSVGRRDLVGTLLARRGPGGP